MSKHSDEAYIEDMLFSAKMIVEYVDQSTEEEFKEDLMMQDAVARRIGIISEAAGRLSASFRHQHSEIPWGKIKGMRNIVVHEYDRVDAGILWQVGAVHAKDLIKLLRKI